MTFRQGESGNPSCRPPGVGRVAELRRMLLSRAPEVIEALINKAIDGDTAAAKMVLDRVIPTVRATDIPISLPRADSGDLTDQSQIIVSHLLSGGLPADIGARLMQSLTAYHQMTALVDLERRILALEEKADGHD